MKNIVVLVSGGGTNLQALIDASERGEIKGGKITCVISSNPNAYALERAKTNGIAARNIPRKEYSDATSYSQAILNALNEEKADLIVLAGFMTILDECVTKAYAYKIINVHPALIPSFCGEGYYGLNFNEAELAFGVIYRGASVHFVIEESDAGAIILQKPVEVLRDDTPEILQRRIMEQAEWKILPQAVSLFCQDKFDFSVGMA